MYLPCKVRIGEDRNESLEEGTGGASQIKQFGGKGMWKSQVLSEAN